MNTMSDFENYRNFLKKRYFGNTSKFTVFLYFFLRVDLHIKNIVLLFTISFLSYTILGNGLWNYVFVILVIELVLVSISLLFKKYDTNIQLYRLLHKPVCSKQIEQITHEITWYIRKYEGRC